MSEGRVQTERWKVKERKGDAQQHLGEMNEGR